MRHLTLAAVCLPLATMFTVPVYAQCPAGIGGNPLAVLTGTWGFKLQGFSSTTTTSTDGCEQSAGARPAICAFSKPTPAGLFGGSSSSTSFVGIIGNFTASNGTTSRSPNVLQGAVIVSETINLNGGFYSGTSGGSFTINSDCSGGTLNLGSGNTGLDTYQFVFLNGFTEIYLLSTTSTFTIIGEARRAP